MKKHKNKPMLLEVIKVFPEIAFTPICIEKRNVEEEKRSRAMVYLFT